ncbi:hypothetical protein Pst134EA_011185 [Puccinia striiformis f. sp. tritici]|uniref:hypothetical protein n=1 Tax=Puccinia striiformis f. sp. tritici TaxID=168172 RepID=UPI002007A03C|nr:hypothetical protein Pst134EA_011185 [Puccinia striiformis f. sp. tritici]KAH9467541.1 hypothetical protein Pst134EA_011185 [Puccinia striiformis f. sp. tritici]
MTFPPMTNKLSRDQPGSFQHLIKCGLCDMRCECDLYLRQHPTKTTTTAYHENALHSFDNPVSPTQSVTTLIAHPIQPAITRLPLRQSTIHVYRNLATLKCGLTAVRMCKSSGKVLRTPFCVTTSTITALNGKSKSIENFWWARSGCLCRWLTSARFFHIVISIFSVPRSCCINFNSLCSARWSTIQ